MVEKDNAAGGDITAQMFPRPIGLVIGLELTGNPFVFYPSYREIADLPLAERVAEMRKPEVRARILADKPGGRRPSADVSGARPGTGSSRSSDNAGLRARPRRRASRRGRRPAA